MKKFSFFTSMTVMVAAVAFVFMACQKEQNPVNTAATSSESNTVSASGTTVLGGNVSNAQAAALLAAYLKTAGPNESRYIEFSISDLQNYLNAMKSKFKSDKVYVNFGVYDASTIPTGKTAYIGRKTVFFSVNNNKKSSGGNVVTFDGGDPTSPDDKDQFNHGNIYP